MEIEKQPIPAVLNCCNRYCLYLNNSKALVWSFKDIEISPIPALLKHRNRLYINGFRNGTLGYLRK